MYLPHCGGQGVASVLRYCRLNIKDKYESKDERYPDYPLFKGLQRPLEFLGIQGRYIYWAAVTTCGAIVGFVAAYCLLGFIAGLVVLATVVSVGIVLILLKQRKGLHSKKVAPGVYVYAHSRKI